MDHRNEIRTEKNNAIILTIGAIVVVVAIIAVVAFNSTPVSQPVSDPNFVATPAPQAEAVTEPATAPAASTGMAETVSPPTENTDAAATTVVEPADSMTGPQTEVTPTSEPLPESPPATTSETIPAPTPESMGGTIHDPANSPNPGTAVPDSTER